MRWAATVALPAMLLVVALSAAQGSEDPDPLPFSQLNTASPDDSAISRDELKEWAAQLSGWAGQISEQDIERFAEVCLQEYDTSQNGAIDSGEAVPLLKELAKMLQGMYNRVLFKMDDTDDDEELSEAECMSSFHFDSAGCEAPMEVFDDNANGKLNILEAKNMAGNVSSLSTVDGPWTEGPFKCYTVPDLSVSGTFCGGTDRVARVCAPSHEDGPTYARMKAHCMVKKFEVDNELTTCATTARDFCENLGGSVRQDARCGLQCQQAMSECLIDSDCLGGTEGTPATLTVSAVDLITGEYPAGMSLQVQVFSGYPWPFYGCKESSFFSCGTMVTQATISGSGSSSVDITLNVGTGAAAWYLIVVGGDNSGYGWSYYEKHLGGGGDNTVYASLLPAMGVNMDRVVLNWPHAGDLDLWIFVKDSSGNIKGTVGWNYGKTSGTFGSTGVSLDKDVMSGLLGSETTSFSNMAGFTFEVWVHYYDSDLVFTKSNVMSTPATLDVYCYECHDTNGRLFKGRVAGVTQDYTAIPDGGKDWWKAGAFHAPSTVGGGSVRVQWKTCFGQACYSDSPAGFQGPILSQGSLSITTKEALTGTGVSASYEIFTDFPSNFVGCRADSADACGTLEKSGSTSGSSSASVQLDVAFGLSSYLVVITASGFYTVYAQVDISGGQTKIVRADMVSELAANQDRVVLSWGSSVDLDLWVIAKNDDGVYQGAVGWNLPSDYSRSATINGATVTLDVDNWDSSSGPETTQIVGLGSTGNGAFEVWVHLFPEAVKMFTREVVSADAALVDVYCYRCHDDSGAEVAGLVKSSRQVASDIPPAGAKWWKVGQYISPSPVTGSEYSRVKWKSCVPSVDTCYTSTNPTVGGAVRRGGLHDPNYAVAYKPDAEKRKSNRAENGVPAIAIPAGVKFHNNPDWQGYKQLNDRMKQAWAKETAKRGEHHVKARLDSERSAGLRSIGGARHQGRSSSAKMLGNQLRNHGMAEYGYTIGDFTWPHHVAAIGDMHLICCDRFELAVRDTCDGVSEAALKTWVDSGMASGWCHETSCFDGQGLRQWAGSLSWLDYTQYRWGNRSFTERSECQETRDWPDLMEHFRSMEACNGGLGKLLVPNRFHVWACFHNHPCATRALTDEIGLWLLYTQGYTDFSIEQINILVAYVSRQIDSVPNAGDGSWDGSAEGALNIEWGVLTYTEVESFFVFIVQMVLTLGEVFGELKVDEIFGDLWWVGLASGQTGTCESIGRDGFACRDQPCCIYNPMLGCQSQPDTHPCFGTGYWIFSMSARGWIGGSSVTLPASYQIYELTDANENSYWGCMATYTCGNPITSGTLFNSTAGTTVQVDASFGSRFFIVFSYTGYNMMYYSIDMFNSEESTPSQMVADLSANNDRALLRWMSEEDLDLWVFVRDPPKNGVTGALRGSVGWEYGKNQLTVGSTSIKYLQDSLSGIDDGPELSSIVGGAGGVYEVWVNIWSEDPSFSTADTDGSGSVSPAEFNAYMSEAGVNSATFASVDANDDGSISSSEFDVGVRANIFTKEMVQIAPATVDVYCFMCHYVKSGMIQVKQGGVGSFTQDWNQVPDTGVKWWKVGEFIAPSTVNSAVRMEWKECTENCYQVEPFPPEGSGQLSITAKDPVLNEQLDGTYYIYRQYPVPFEGCFQSRTCGVQVYNGTLDNTMATIVQVDVNYGVSNYLIVIISDGYYPYYSEQAVSDGGTRVVSGQMVETLPSNEDRVVLRWESAQDLDLWIVFYNAAGNRVGSVGYSSPGKSGTFAVGSATLDVDNFNGALGPETTVLANLANGRAEVWVHKYRGLAEGDARYYYYPEDVRADPATVDVYCGYCHSFEGNLVQGGVKSATQIASNVPANGAKWWKVGQFVAPSPLSGSVRSQWQTCVKSDGRAEIGAKGSGCWTNNNPTASGRRRSTGPADTKRQPPRKTVKHKDPYMDKVMAARLKRAAKQRKEKIATNAAKKEQRVEQMNSQMHKRARYYTLKNLDGGGIRSTYSTPADAKKKKAPGKNAGREWTENDRKVVTPLIRNIKFLKHVWAERYGLDKMEAAINKGRASDRKEKFRVRSVDSPAGPREAMCYVYDEAYKNWVPWGPNSLLQIHDWSAIWDRPHWPQYEEVYKHQTP